MLSKTLLHASAWLNPAAVAALLVLPSAASAQVLYAGGYVSKVPAYEAKTGKSLAGFVPIENAASGLALKGNTLYCANKIGVGTYDATTGAPINANFITGLDSPTFIEGLAIYRNTLFVPNVANSTLSTYDATTGALLNEKFITELARPFSLWVEDETLYVSNVIAYGGTKGGDDDGSVHAYHATTGKPLEGFRVIKVGTPKGLLVVDNILYVASAPRDSISAVGKDPASVGVSTIGTYHAKTGAAINATFAVLGDSSPRGMAILDKTLFFSNYRLGSVGTCDATTGKLIDNAFVKGVNNATALVLATPASAP